MLSGELKQCSNLPLFADLSAQHLDELGQMLHKRTVKSGRDLLHWGICSQEVYILLKGTVKVYVPTDQGTEVVLSLLGRGEVLGEISALDGLYHSASIVTIEETDFLITDAKAFCRCLQTMPQLSYNLLSVFARRLRRVTDQAAALAALDVPGRLARQLLLFAREYATAGTTNEAKIQLRLTQSDLAGLIGSSREVTNRALGGFRRQGLISVGRDCYITIHDRDALAKRCQRPPKDI